MDELKRSVGAARRGNIGGSKEKEKGTSEKGEQRKLNPLFAVRELPVRPIEDKTKITTTINPLRPPIERVDSLLDDRLKKRSFRLSGGHNRDVIIAKEAFVSGGGGNSISKPTTKATPETEKKAGYTPPVGARRLVRYNSEKKVSTYELVGKEERNERAKLIQKLRSEIQQQKDTSREGITISVNSESAKEDKEKVDKIVAAIFGEEDKGGELLWARMGIRRSGSTAGIPTMPKAGPGMVDDILDDLLGKRDPPAEPPVPVRARRPSRREAEEVGVLSESMLALTASGKMGWLDLARAAKIVRERASTVDCLVDVLFGVDNPPAPEAPRSPPILLGRRSSSKSVWERGRVSEPASIFYELGGADSVPSGTRMRSEAQVEPPADLSLLFEDSAALSAAESVGAVIGPHEQVGASPLPLSALSSAPTGPQFEESHGDFLAGFEPALRSLPHHILLAIKSQQESRALKATRGRGSLSETKPDEEAGLPRRRGTTTVVTMKRNMTGNKSISVIAQVRRTKSEPFLSSWDYSVQQIYRTNSGIVSTLVSGPVIVDSAKEKHPEIVNLPPLGRHRSSSVVIRESFLARRSTRSSSILSSGTLSGRSSFVSSSLTDSTSSFTSPYSSLADSSNAYSSSCSSFNNTSSFVSPRTSFSADLSEVAYMSADVSEAATDLSEATGDVLSESGEVEDGVDSEASDTEPEDDDTDDILQHDGRPRKARPEKEPQALDGLRTNEKAKKKEKQMKGETEPSAEEQAAFEEYQRQLQELLNKRVTEIKYAEDGPVSGTVEGLIAALFHEDDGMDSMYLDTFLATHSYFISSRDLFFRLKDLYMGVTLDSRKFTKKKHKHLRPQLLNVRLRVVNTLKKWLETFYSDFYTDPGLLKELEAFEKLMSGLGGKSLHWQAILRISRAKAQLKQDKTGKRTVVTKDAPKPLIPRQLQSPSLLDFHPLEVARQLALIDWELFASIPHREFVSKAWANPSSSPVSQKWFQHYEKGINWIATEIIMTPNPKQRAIVIQRFIEIAECCLSLNNFNGTIQIISALRLNFVARLKAAWKGVPQKYTAKLKALEELVAPVDGYAKLKAYMAELSPPLVPYHQLLQYDLEVIEEQHSNNFVLVSSSDGKKRREPKKKDDSDKEVRTSSEKKTMGKDSDTTLRRNSKKDEKEGTSAANTSPPSLSAPSSPTKSTAILVSSGGSKFEHSGSSGKVAARAGAPQPALVVNFEKMRALGPIFLDIATLQMTPLKLEEVAVIKQYLVNPPVVLSDKDLMLGSRSCEPAQESPISGVVRRKSSKEKDKIDFGCREDLKKVKQGSIRLSLSAAVKKTFDKKKMG